VRLGVVSRAVHPAPPIDLDLISFFNRPGSPLLDSVMRVLSDQVTLIALAVALGLYIYFRSPQKKTGVLVLILAIAASDLTAARVVKPLAERTRPCNLKPPATQTLLTCQTSVSFPSNHAANAAAAATIATWAAPVISPFCILLALLIGISRVYLGQHWPTDVLGGWALGFVIGFVFIQLARMRYSVHRRPAPTGDRR
jgi:undecaprenyl-diphosphatase